MKEVSLNAGVQEGEAEDQRLDCFRQCLQKLDPASRDLITSYYEEEKGGKADYRRDLAEQLSVSLNTLRLRTHRIRAKLERCVLDCVGATFAR